MSTRRTSGRSSLRPASRRPLMPASSHTRRHSTSNENGQAPCRSPTVANTGGSPPQSHHDARTESNDTQVSCSTCAGLREKITNLESEVERVNSLFQEAKSEMHREKLINTQLSQNHTNICASMSSLQSRYDSLAARFDVLQESVPLHSSRFRGKKNSSKREETFSQMRKARLKCYVKGIPEKYHALFLQVRGAAEDFVFDEITESCVLSNQGISEDDRVHDWSGLSEQLDNSTDEFQGTSPLKLISNCSRLVPKHPHIFLGYTFFTQRQPHPECMMKKCFDAVLADDDMFDKFRSSEASQAAWNCMKEDAATKSYFSRVVSTTLSNHLREAKVHYFTSLGYDLFNPKAKLSNDEKVTEREDLKMAFHKRIHGASVTLDTIDTSLWRKSSWSDLYNPSKECPEEPQVTEIDNFGTDILFNNSAARSAFLSFLRHTPGKQDSVLSLARADAWFTACAFILGEGRGGKHNIQFRDACSKMLPRCLRSILGILHEKVTLLSPHELTKPTPSSFVPSLKQPTSLHHSLRVEDRIHTNVVMLPSDGFFYVYMTPTSFRAHICHWMYFVDAYFAKTSFEEDQYHPFSSSTSSALSSQKRTSISSPRASPKRHRSIFDADSDECNDDEFLPNHDDSLPDDAPLQ